MFFLAHGGGLLWLIIWVLIIATLLRTIGRRPWCGPRRWERHWYGPHYDRHWAGPVPPPPGAPVPPPYTDGPHTFSQGDALEILRRRYAAGEIDGPTYDQMRERLEGSGK